MKVIGENKWTQAWSQGLSIKEIEAIVVIIKFTSRRGTNIRFLRQITYYISAIELFEVQY